MNNDIDYTNNPNPRRGKAVAGTILLIVGALLLIHQFDFFFFPNWIFSWPMWLIAWGLFMGARHNWRNSSWIIMIIIGGAFLLNDILPGYNMHDVAWPIMIIGIGIYMILKRNSKWDKGDWKNFGGGKWDRRHRQYGNQTQPPVVDYTTTSDSDIPPVEPSPASSASSSSSYRSSPDDYLDAVSVFGGVKKTILSKDFKGGEIVNVFGGAELDFTQANINGQVVIDITQIFGGTKIVVPAHWRVVPDMAAVFASVDDKRIRTSAAADSDKILVLKGTSIFAGVDIRSY
jgi:predicted membrane protein